MLQRLRSASSLRRSLRSAAVLAAAFAALATAARAGTANFYDGDFTAGWLDTKVLDTTPGASATFVTQVANGGIGVGNYHQTSHTWSNGAIVVAHYMGAMWDPTVAPACTIDYSFTARHFTGSTVGGAVRVRPLIFQQGTTYHQVTGLDVFVDAWTSFVQLDLTPTSFVKVDGPGPDIPDFSCSGWPLVFGYTTANSANGGPITKVVGVDDFSVTVHYARDEYYDGTFTLSDWSEGVVLDSSPGQINTFSASSPSSGGNPGDYHFVSHTFSQGTLLVGHLSWVLLHDPAVAPIYAIDYGYDAAHFTAPPPPLLGAVSYQMAIAQNNALYVGPQDLVYDAAWTHFNRNLLHASDFTFLIGTGPPHPDFSAAGGLCYFGYVTGTTYAGLTPVTKTCGMDNFTVLVHTSPPCAVLTGSVFCEGTGAVGPCPCFPAIPAGQPGHGCPNSVFPSGGRLVAAGTASIANDTVVLQATAMPNSSCIFFQGDANSPAPVYDGIACVSGSLIRLGTKTNNCNSSQYPDPVNTKVSVRGQITAPGTRLYQVWYRNAAATFCTPATSNYTNGIQINWSL